MVAEGYCNRYISLFKNVHKHIDESFGFCFVADILGEHVYEYFLRSKWSEWHNYQEQITPWELRSNLDY